MPVTCAFCQKNYSEKMAKCPFCGTAGGHAPPPVAPQPSLTPAAAAAAQDPELKKKMMLAAVQMKTDYPTEFSHTSKFSLSSLNGGMRAAIVLWMLAALCALGGLILLMMPIEGKERLAMRAMGAGGLIGALIYGGLGYGAWRGLILCV